MAENVHFHNFESQIKFLESLLSLSFFSIFSHISSFSSCPNNNPRIQWMRRSSPTLSLPIESSFSESHRQPSLSLWHSFRYPQRRQTLHPHCRTTPWLVPETKCEQDRQLRMVSWMCCSTLRDQNMRVTSSHEKDYEIRQRRQQIMQI